jgi:hypothetical protein
MRVNIYLEPPHRALEGARTTEGPWSLSLISFTVNRGRIQESGEWGEGGGDCIPAAPTNRNFKNTDFVHMMILNILHDLPFSRN